MTNTRKHPTGDDTPRMKAPPSRRDFIKASAVLGGCALFAGHMEKVRAILDGVAFAAEDGQGFAYRLADPENILYTTCLQCHIRCDLKVKLLDGVIVKIDGSPYSAQNLMPNLSYETTPTEAASADGKICPRGQAGIQTMYDPYRLVKVLKRTGPRGSNQWKTVPFDQAVREIVEGGRLFADIGEDHEITGLKDVYALRDPDLSKAMGADVGKLKKGELTVADFKRIHADHLDVLIDPEHPDLGPKNNQFVMLSGRIEHGRKEFSQRFLSDGFGSVNWFEHTSICEQSHHIAYDRMTSEYEYDDEEGEWKWGKGKTNLKPDLLNAEYVIFFGTGAFEANFGVTPMAEKVTHSLRERSFSYAVVDPRLSKTAAKAQRWVPVTPGTDGALALGMIRWILENERFDRTFLENANKAAAGEDGESSFSDASYLVKIENDRPTRYLRADEVGVGAGHEFVVRRSGNLSAVNPADDEDASPAEGDLFVDATVGGIRVKSALQLLSESAAEMSLAGYAETCGISQDVIEELAREFTSHGKKAAVEFYRGPAQHTNGFYGCTALVSLNVLIGNMDWTGGLSKGGGHWHEFGDKEGQPYKMAELYSAKHKAFGIPVSKEKWKYEDTTLVDGYPAKRPFYPLTSNVYQEVIPAARAGFPYPVKVLWNHMGTPAYSTPAGDKFIDALLDTDKIPLFISSDIVIGETTMYADYVFPDITFLERWASPHTVPDVQSKSSHVRQPVGRPLTESVTVGEEEMPISLEAMCFAIAEALGLPAFGKDAFGPGMDLTRPEDYYLKLVANIAMGDGPGDEVPSAEDAELALFETARRHLPKVSFDPERWKRALEPSEWEKVVFVLNRGGRFEAFDKAYEGDHLHHDFGKLMRLYLEDVAATKHSGTGEAFSGLPAWIPVADSLGRPLEAAGYDLHLITYKEIFHTQSRTMSNYWNLPFDPENHVVMSRRDADRLGLEDGEAVRLASASNPSGEFDIGGGDRVVIQGPLRVIEGVRPGVVVVSHHYGHWAYGSQDVFVDGELIAGEARRRKGLSPNAVMLTDPVLKDVCLTDPIGGSAAFFDTLVTVTRA